jgi:hypothetical protein
MSPIRTVVGSVIATVLLTALVHFAAGQSCQTGCIEFKDKSPPMISGSQCWYYFDNVVRRTLVGSGNSLLERGTVVRTGIYAVPFEYCAEVCTASP